MNPDARPVWRRDWAWHPTKKSGSHPCPDRQAERHLEHSPEPFEAPDIPVALAPGSLADLPEAAGSGSADGSRDGSGASPAAAAPEHAGPAPGGEHFRAAHEPKPREDTQPARQRQPLRSTSAPRWTFSSSPRLNPRTRSQALRSLGLQAPVAPRSPGPCLTQSPSVWLFDNVSSWSSNSALLSSSCKSCTTASPVGGAG